MGAFSPFPALQSENISAKDQRLQEAVVIHRQYEVLHRLDLHGKVTTCPCPAH